jgi:hypothetical protein
MQQIYLSVSTALKHERENGGDREREREREREGHTLVAGRAEWNKRIAVIL